MDENRYVISVDLGVNGALAVFPPGSDKPAVYDMPAYVVTHGNKGTKAFRTEAHYDAVELAKLLRPYGRKPIGDVIVVLEAPIIKHGVGRKAVRKTFEGYGILRGLCAAFSLRMELSKPSEWKIIMGLRGKSKEASRQAARRIWPGFQGCNTEGLKEGQTGLDRVADHDRAEAMLLGRWWRMGGPLAPKQGPVPEPKKRKKKKKRKAKRVKRK